MRACAQKEGQFSSPLSCVNIDTLRESDAHSFIYVNKGDNVTTIRLHINIKWNLDPMRETEWKREREEKKEIEIIIYIYIFVNSMSALGIF